LFEYECCSYSPALFDQFGEPSKTALDDALRDLAKLEQTEPSDDDTYILDGGALV